MDRWERLKEIAAEWSIEDEKWCIKEIERLRREKEWLFERDISTVIKFGIDKTECRKKLSKDMQQALRGGVSEGNNLQDE